MRKSQSDSVLAADRILLPYVIVRILPQKSKLHFTSRALGPSIAGTQGTVDDETEMDRGKRRAVFREWEEADTRG